MFKIVVALATFLLAGCASQKSPPQPSSPATQPSRLRVDIGMNNDFLVGGMSLEKSDLAQLVKESGPNRPVVLYGSSLRQLIEVKHEFESAGFANVVIGPAVGE